MNAIEKKVTEIAKMKPSEIVQHPRVVEMFKRMYGEKESFIVFEREKTFALQALQDNAFLMQTAEANKLSLYAAMINCAINRLTLNPQLRLGYLVPRDKKIMFQASYQGKLEILQNAGAIEAVKTMQVVYDCDEWVYNLGQIEKHIPKNPRPAGAKITGAYVIVIMTNKKGVMFDKQVYMDIAAIQKRREKSPTKQGNIWNAWEDEMCIKTVVNKLFKECQKTDTFATQEHLAREASLPGMPIPSIISHIDEEVDIEEVHAEVISETDPNV